MFSSLPYWAGKAIGCAIIFLVGLAVLAVLFSVGSLFGPDRGEWVKESIDWDYGSIVLNDSGDDVTYSSGFGSLYTKDSIPCTGYQITVSFPAGVNLKVYYFDVEDKCIGTKDINDERFVKFVPGSDELPEGVAAIRLCLTPDGGNDVFKMPYLNIGNIVQKWVYSDYVKLEITNSVKTTIDNVTGI